MKVLGKYKNGNYNVTILSDGTKIRQTEEDCFIPEFAENIDVKITSKCKINCPFCYEGCYAGGKHAELMIDKNTPAQKWIETLHPYTELAINGNDMNHPQLLDFLEYLKNKKVIANITVHHKQFMDNIDLLRHLRDNKYIHGLGVSLAQESVDSDFNYECFYDRLKEFPNAVIHTIAGITDIADYKHLLHYYPEAKILILGFKELKRGEKYSKVKNNQVFEMVKELQEFLPKLQKKATVLSFDNLALEQLNVRDVLFKGKNSEWEMFYMGDDGNHTFYIDAVSKTFSKNSCVTKEKRKNIENLTSLEMFKIIRNENSSKTECI